VSSLARIGIALLVLWAVLWLGFKIVGGLVHLLVVVGVVLLIWGLVKRGARGLRDRV
jgi:hypothetical protein